MRPGLSRDRGSFSRERAAETGGPAAAGGVAPQPGHTAGNLPDGTPMRARAELSADRLSADRQSADRLSAAWPWLAAVAIVLLATTLRCVGIQSRWLWLDELIGVNFASDGLSTTLATALRFDTHPPLYYLQLELWEAISHNDVWLMLNSVLWSVAAIVLLMQLARRRYGWPVALAAGQLLAVAPAALFYADQVRMYGFITIPVMWAWYAQLRWPERPGLAGTAALLASQLVAIYSHTAGIVMVSGCVAMGGVLVLRAGSPRLLLRWLLLEAAVGALAVPALAIALLRDVQHIHLPDAADVLATWTFLIAGVHTPSGPAAAVAVAVLALLLVFALRNRAHGLVAGVPVLVPMLLALAISYARGPIWIDRIFVFSLPFICLLLALGLMSTPAPAVRPSRVGLATLAALLAAGSIVGATDQTTRTKGDGSRTAAQRVHDIARPGDLVVLTGTYAYWCFMWYYSGPRWGRPLHTYILTDDWKRMTGRLPTGVAAWLGLDAQDHERTVDGVRVLLLDPGAVPPPVEGAVIVVNPRALAPIAVPGRQVAERFEEQQLAIERWVPAATP